MPFEILVNTIDIPSLFDQKVTHVNFLSFIHNSPIQDSIISISEYQPSCSVNTNLGDDSTL